MVEVTGGVTPHAKAEQPAAKDSAKHEIKSYQPALERQFGAHSFTLLRLAGLRGKDISSKHVLELGAGHFDTFKTRADYVAGRGGHYTAMEIRSDVADMAKRDVQTDNTRKSRSGDIQVEQGNANALHPDLLGSQDVVIVSRIGGGSTPQECLQMLADLKRVQATNPTPDTEEALSYLQTFTDNIARHGLDPDGTLAGPDKHVLVFLNAYLALKAGGRLVFSQNDQGDIPMNTIQAKSVLRDIGFTNVTMDHSVASFIQNSLTITELPHVLMKKLAGERASLRDYEVLNITADKPTTDTLGASR